ncbi:MAG: alpha/beta hydrolase [Thermomicrobiales bacterium]|nr:alpha/beta hydrolase [Thermomicrobiales bacterium]
MIESEELEPRTVAHRWHVLDRIRLSRRAALRGFGATAPMIGLALHEMQWGHAHDATPVGDVTMDAAGLVDIGGRSLYLTCAGSGGPTVVLVSGYRDTSDVWTVDLSEQTPARTMVMPAVASFTRVCAYDRPGTATSTGDIDFISRSDAIPQPRTLPDVVEELHALVHASGIATPFVLSAHSLGGAAARLYASTYPDDVSGMVLVDAYSEFIETLMTPEQWESLVTFNAGLGTDTVVPIPDYGDLETIPYGSANPALRDATDQSPLREMPLAVLAHGVPFDIDEPPEGFTPTELEGFLTRSNEYQATLVPDTRYLVGETSGHYIQQDQPELVIEAIRQVVTGVREPETWTSLDSCCGS